MSETHAALTWDGTGDRFYETGLSKGVLYPMDASGAYPKGVAWNGLTSIDDNPDGAEPNDLWADNIKYASFRSAETYGGSISAYTYPDEWGQCDGSASPTGLEGMQIRQQKRHVFGLCYRTEVGNDTVGESDDGYILHLVYGATASPSQKQRQTINENPDAVEFSWDFTTTPVAVTGQTTIKPTSKIELHSLKLGSTKMTAIENVLYGSSTADARLPLPAEVISILNAAT